MSKKDVMISYEDLSKYKSSCSTYYHYRGLLHRRDGPSEIFYHNSGRDQYYVVSYFMYGYIHRKDEKDPSEHAREVWDQDKKLDKDLNCVLDGENPIIESEDYIARHGYIVFEDINKKIRHEGMSRCDMFVWNTEDDYWDVKSAE